MKTLRRLIYRQVLISVAVVTLGFLALFFFFDFLDQIRNIGKSPGYSLQFAFLIVFFELPGHLYELLPITVLIGTIFVMAKFAQNSEFTIMRSSGLTPRLALQNMLALGLGFVAFTAVLGDYIVPATERAALEIQSQYLGRSQSVGNTGAWMKEADGVHMKIVNVRAVNASGHLQQIRIFEMNEKGQLIKQWYAQQGQALNRAGIWQLEHGEYKKFDYIDDAKINQTAKNPVQITAATFDKMDWPTSLSGDMVLAAAYKPSHMSMVDLWKFSQHLKANDQTAQRYDIEFWRKIFYPISCLVMVVLALPFAYLHFRSGGITLYVFIGVMAGISFFLLNNVFSYAGRLQNWPPLWSAAAPSILYTAISLMAFTWLVLRR